MTRFLGFLTVGTVFMLIPLLIAGRWYQNPIYKSVLVAIILTIVGTCGTYLLGYIEDSFQFGNRSFYGAVFLIPVMFLLVAKLLRLPYGKLMDISAPAVCMMLTLMKLLCAFNGCCSGRELIGLDGHAFIFPSQRVECECALALMVVLLVLIRRQRHIGEVYSWFLIVYGISRFVLNFFRENLTAFVWILPPGHFWSIIAVLIGVIWLVVCRMRKISCGCTSAVPEV